MRNFTIRAALLYMGVLLCIPPAATGQQDTVLKTVHNLSVSGPGEIRSLTEREVCKFCHVPHSAVVPELLWGHAISKTVYRTAPLRRGRMEAQPAPQPDGASRLCLSCHDGTVALGEVAGESKRIEMVGADTLRPGSRGYVGTDLSGSHPISFVVDEPDEEIAAEDSDMGIRPVAAIRADPDVKLDAAGKMQCTSCHDPHSDRYFVEGRVPRFWVKPTLDAVCTTCHAPT